MCCYTVERICASSCNICFLSSSQWINRRNSVLKCGSFNGLSKSHTQDLIQRLLKSIQRLTVIDIGRLHIMPPSSSLHFQSAPKGSSGKGISPHFYRHLMKLTLYIFSRSFFANKLLGIKSYRCTLFRGSITFTNYNILQFTQVNGSSLEAEINLYMSLVPLTGKKYLNSILSLLYIVGQSSVNMITIINMVVFCLYSHYQHNNSINNQSFS